MREQALHAHRTKLTKGSRRPVIQYSRKGKEIARFVSVEAAAEAMKTPQYNISRCANGRRPTAAGYIFKFEEPRQEILNLEGEEWRECKRNSNYLVSNLGRIGHKTRFEKDFHLLTQRETHGYRAVNFIIGHKRCIERVHRLVAECFVDNPHGYNVVNHKDHDRSNNVWHNLEWTTFTGNNRHGSGKPILQLNSKKEIIRRFASISEAMEDLNISREHIKECLTSKLRISYHGWYFKHDVSSKVGETKTSKTSSKCKTGNVKCNSEKMYDKHAMSDVSSSSSESSDDEMEEVKSSKLNTKRKTYAKNIDKKSHDDTSDEDSFSDEKERVQKSSKKRGNYIPWAKRRNIKKSRDDISEDEGSESSEDSDDEIKHFWALQTNNP